VLRDGVGEEIIDLLFIIFITASSGDKAGISSNVLPAGGSDRRSNTRAASSCPCRPLRDARRLH